MITSTSTRPGIRVDIQYWYLYLCIGASLHKRVSFYLFIYKFCVFASENTVGNITVNRYLVMFADNVFFIDYIVFFNSF